MRCFYIDAENTAVEEWTDFDGTEESIKAVLGATHLAKLQIGSSNDYMWVDDDAEFNGTMGFDFGGVRYYGNAIILGQNEWGETMDTELPDFFMMMLLGERYP